jgi:malate synthase
MLMKKLVVPVNNARYALNAANARWGSLFDALHFTHAIPFAGIKPSAATLDAERFTATVAWMDDFLDSVIALNRGVKHSVTEDGELVISTTSGRVTLAEPELFVGYNMKTNSILFKHNDLHLQLLTGTPCMLVRYQAGGSCQHHPGL